MRPIVFYLPMSEWGLISICNTSQDRTGSDSLATWAQDQHASDFILFTTQLQRLGLEQCNTKTQGKSKQAGEFWGYPTNSGVPERSYQKLFMMLILWFISHISDCRPTKSGEKLHCKLESPAMSLSAHPWRTLQRNSLWSRRSAGSAGSARLDSLSFKAKKSIRSLRFCSSQEQLLVWANPVRLKSVIMKSHTFFNTMMVKFMKRSWGRAGWNRKIPESSGWGTRAKRCHIKSIQYIQNTSATVKQQVQT